MKPYQNRTAGSGLTVVILVFVGYSRQSCICLFVEQAKQTRSLYERTGRLSFLTLD
jgi:hypothetical protein